LQEKSAIFLGKEYYIIYKYIIYFLKGFGEEKSTGGNKKSRQRRWRTQDKEGLKAIETRSRNSRAQDNVEREQMKAGWHPAEYEEGKAGFNPAEKTRKKKNCLLGKWAGRSSDRSSFRVIERSKVTINWSN